MAHEPSFQFYPAEFLLDAEVRGMSLRDRGAMFTRLLEAVVDRDVEAVAEWQGRFVGRVFWHVKQTRPAIPTAVRQAVFAKYGRACVKCGSRERLELDHVVAYSKGGPDTADNLQPMCKTCNRRKGAN